ncbi:hypothetical protein GCM10022252_74370 [Streptosporangium oxazolinicum]|uniref:Uncharacterized protein n=1 Tax=Streptosporangium oxazolinicum TaxID=909287 RepID=A0ABP8BJZ1_9ACTN
MAPCSSRASPPRLTHGYAALAILLTLGPVLAFALRRAPADPAPDRHIVNDRVRDNP